MAREEAEKHYQDQGLMTEYCADKPGKTYPPHRHEQTFLYTLSGSVKIRLDEGEWQQLESGNEFMVGSNQLHEAVVGEDGWEYVAAWDAEEAKKYPHVH